MKKHSFENAKRVVKRAFTTGLAAGTLLVNPEALNGQTTDTHPGFENRQTIPDEKKQPGKKEEKEWGHVRSKVAPENVETVRGIVLRSYVDTADPKIMSVDSLVGIDPHTNYISKDKFEKRNGTLESKTVSKQFLLPDKITGYIKLEAFGPSSSDEAEEAINKLKS